MKRLTIHLLLLLPLVFLLSQLFIFEVNDPIKYIYIVSGITATVILFFSITISMIKKHINLMKFRKDIGLFGFFYALLHMVNFVVFDAQLDLGFIIEETLDKPFIYLGMIAFFYTIIYGSYIHKKVIQKV